MAAVDDWLERLLSKDGTDLHLAPGSPPLARIGPDLVALAPNPLDAATLDSWLLALLNPSQRATLQDHGDLLFTHSYRPDVRFRVHYTSGQGGNRAVFHGRTAPVPPQELGVPEGLTEVADGSRGLIVVTGPRGSGKSSTAAALVSAIAQRSPLHIVVIGNPIEVRLQSGRAHITYKEVGRHVPSVAAAIDAARREAADVVYLGDVAPGETLNLAIALASTGPQVILTMDAPTITTAIERIFDSAALDQQPALRNALADSLQAMVGQHLIPRTNGAGGVAAFEVLLGTPEARARLRAGRTKLIPKLIEAGQLDGMRTLDSSLSRLVKEELVAGEDARRVAIAPDAFAAEHNL